MTFYVRAKSFFVTRLSDALTGTAFINDREPDASTWALNDRGRWLDPSAAERQLQRFDELYSKCYVARMELRLGLPATGQGFETNGTCCEVSLARVVGRDVW